MTDLALNAANRAKSDQIGNLTQQARDILGFDDNVGLPGMRKRLGTVVSGNGGGRRPVVLASSVRKNVLVPIGTIDA